MSKNITHHEQETVAEAVNQTEHFIEKYKKPLIYSVITIVAIAAISFAYQQFSVNLKLTRLWLNHL